MFRLFSICIVLTIGLSACAPPEMRDMQQPDLPHVSRATQAMYGAVHDGGYLIPAIEPQHLSDDKARQRVAYWTNEAPGTIVVDPWARFLYFVEEGNTAMRYAVAVGDQGRGFSGTAKVGYQRSWPNWTPTKNMIRNDPETYGPVADGLEGGLENPLGARALYLYRNGRDTMYRIHGTPYPWSIGRATSAGCIRLYNQDSIDLASRVADGAKVIVLRESQSGLGTAAATEDPLSSGF